MIPESHAFLERSSGRKRRNRYLRSAFICVGSSDLAKERRGGYVQAFHSSAERRAVPTLAGSNVDSRTRAQLERLLAEAQREFAELHGIWSWTCPHLGVHNLLGVAAENLLDKIVEAHGAEFGSLQVWDEGTRSLRLIAHCNFDRRSAQQFAIVRDGDGTVCEVARVSRAPVFVEDIEKEEKFTSLRGWTRAIGIRAIQTTPVFRRSGIFIGAFSTHYASPQTFTSVQKEINTVYADRIGYLFADLVGV